MKNYIPIFFNIEGNKKINKKLKENYLDTQRGQMEKRGKDVEVTDSDWEAFY